MGNRYDRKTGYVFGGASSFWFVFVAIALVVWLSPLFMKQQDSLTRTLLVGMGALLLDLCLRFSYYGIQIDPEKKIIREYTSLLGHKAGDWENLPNFKRLRFTSNSSRAWNSPNGISPTISHTRTTYSISLFSHAASPDYTIKTENKEEALQDIQKLREMLHLEVEESL